MEAEAAVVGSQRLQPYVCLPVCLSQERGLQTAKYKDVCAQLHEEFFDACLAHSFVALLRVLQACAM